MKIVLLKSQTKKFSLVLLLIASLFVNVNAQTDSILASPLEELLESDSTLTTPSTEDSRKVETDTLIQDTLNGLKGDLNDITHSGFNFSEIELKTSDIVSNVLKIYNNTNETIKFKVDLIYPGDWDYLTQSDEFYELSTRDTAYIPVVLIPNKLINGNTEITLNAFIISDKNQQVGNNHFLLKTKKITSWNVNIDPSNKFYFKNGETSKKFKYSIENTGNFKQDIFVNYRVLKGGLMLLDTNNRMVKDPNFTFNIESWEDTSLTYIASIISGKERNFRKKSIDGYLPNNNLEYKKYTLFINSSEPKGIEKNSYKKGNKVDFIKLPNQAKFQDYGYPHLPLTVEANVQNILANNTLMAINLRGFKQLKNEAIISYYSQLNYTQNYYGNKFLENAPWYVGYFDPKKSVEIGNVSGNIIGINANGKGIKGAYAFSEKHKTGAFIVRGPGLFGERKNTSLGASHLYTHNANFKINAAIGRQENYLTGKNINAISLMPRFNLNRHYFSIVSAFTSNETISQDSTSSIYGYLIGATYNSSFFQKKLKLNAGATYYDKGFSNGAYERININNRATYAINDNWNAYLNNYYQNNKNINPFTDEVIFKQEILSNSIVFQRKHANGAFQPGLFYDYSDLFSNKIHNRGLSFRYSTFNFLQNFMTSVTVRAGFALPLGFESRKDFFNFRLTSLLRYKVWSFTSGYNYGALSVSSLQRQDSQSSTPQNIRFALQNQYQFKNKHFVLESSASYNYTNINAGHNVSMNPQLFFFTNTGWRFSLNGNYTFNTSSSGSFFTENQLIGFEITSQRTLIQNIMIGASIKKDFGIPIPFIKQTAASIDFVCFYDLNGDGKKDPNEPAIENAIVRLGNKEVISNAKGKAVIQNIPLDVYSFSVSSLDDLNGWFPNTDDSLQIIASKTAYIPFLRGIKVYGDVVLDRQKIAIADTSKLFDLSRIRITAVNGKTFNTLTDVNGRFEFYMPNGDYVITMDENILGDRYTISRNNIPMTLTNKQDGVYISFYIIEKRKKVTIKEFGND